MGFFTEVAEWWRAQGRARGRGLVRTRVALPAVVDVAVDVLRELRSLDERLDLYVLPDGLVWLLFKSDKPARIASGRKELLDARWQGWDPLRGPMYTASLMAEGFERWGEYPFLLGTSAGFLLNTAAEKWYASERRAVDAMRERRAHADGTRHKERAIRVVRERVTLGARDDHAWAFTGRRSFSNQR